MRLPDKISYIVFVWLALAKIRLVGAVPGGESPISVRRFGDLNLGQSFKVLPGLLSSAVVEHLERLEDQMGAGTYPLACGYWCDSDMAALRQGLSDELGISPRQLGEVRLEDSTGVYVHESLAAVAMVYLDMSKLSVGAAWRTSHGTEISLAWPGLDTSHGSAVLMPRASSVEFPSPVKVAIIPVLKRSRPVWDYYIGTGLWKALVSSHYVGTFLGLGFFRAHTKSPVFWHACVWSAIGSALLMLLGMPLLFRPIVRAMEALEARYFSSRTEDVPCNLPTLLPKHRRMQQFGPGCSPLAGNCSPCTPKFQQLNWQL